MGLLGAGDFLYALRFLRLLTMPWEKTAAFKAGIVDKDGKKLKKPETSEEKSSYNTFHKLVFNLRRLIQKVPVVGKSTLARYGAALWLIKEHTKLSDEDIKSTLMEAGVEFDMNELYESKSLALQEGEYKINKDLPLRTTGEMLAFEGTNVIIKQAKPIGYILSHPVYEAIHKDTQSVVNLTAMDIKEMITTSAVATRPMPLKKKKRKEDDEVI
jgi:hypothetical protein